MESKAQKAALARIEEIVNSECLNFEIIKIIEEIIKKYALDKKLLIEIYNRIYDEAMKRKLYNMAATLAKKHGL